MTKLNKRLHIGFKSVTRMVVLFSCLLVGIFGSGAAVAAQIKPDMYYLMTNSFLKESRVMAVGSSDKLVMANKSKQLVPAQLWKFTPIKGKPSYYRITNALLGDGKSLDSSASTPHIAKSGNYSGQQWKLIRLSNGYTRLSNMYQPTKSLDTYGSAPNSPFLGKMGNYSGQLWKLTLSSDQKGVEQVKSSSNTASASTPLVMTQIMVNDGKSITNVSPVQTTNLSEDSAPSIQGQLVVGSTAQLLSADMPVVIVKGCLTDMTLPGCAPRLNMEKDFPPPSLGAFLINGGESLLNKIYGRPDVIISYLSGPFKVVRDTTGGVLTNPAKNGLQHMCTEPVMNDPAAALMFAMLLDTIAKQPNQRSAEEKRFLKAVASFISRRKQFVVQRAQRLYNKELAKLHVTDEKPKSRFTALMTSYGNAAPSPRDLFDSMVEPTIVDGELRTQVYAYLAAITHKPVLRHLAPNIAKVRAWQKNYTTNKPYSIPERQSGGSYREAVTDAFTIYASQTLVGGLGSRYKSPGLRYLNYLSGHGYGEFKPKYKQHYNVGTIDLIGAYNLWKKASRSIPDIQVQYAKWWTVLNNGLALSVEELDRPIDLDSYKLYEDGPLQLAAYWALAVSSTRATYSPNRWNTPDAIGYQSNGSRTARKKDCAGITGYSNKIPASIAGGRLVYGKPPNRIGHTAASFSDDGRGKYAFSRKYSPSEILVASGLSGSSLPHAGMRVSVGDAAYKAVVNASTNNYNVAKIAEYIVK